MFPAAADRRGVVTLLGVRFVDHALEAPVADGLRVAAQPLDSASPATPAVRTPSGVHGFHGLPGLHAAEHPKPGAPAAPGARPFAVLVEDRLGRFLPMLFLVDLPLDTAALPGRLPLLAAHLFSAPTRTVASGLATVRADLWDEEADAPAAHAVLRVTVEGRTALGVADAEGRALVVFPFPPAERLHAGPGTSPPDEQGWTLAAEVSYSPGLGPPGSSIPFPPPWTRLPGIKAILQDQAPARIRTAGGGADDALAAELAYGRELVLRTPPGARLSIVRGSLTP